MNMSTTLTPMKARFNNNVSNDNSNSSNDTFAQRKQAKKALQSDRRLARNNKHLAKTL